MMEMARLSFAKVAINQGNVRKRTFAGYLQVLKSTLFYSATLSLELL